MKKIYALTDYKGHFGSKWKAKPYRSGLDKESLIKYFANNNWEIQFIQFKDIDFKDNWKDKLIIYTSSEEFGLYYKSYIEDVVLGLVQAGAKVIPGYAFLRANNNKVFMEILREHLLKNIPTGIFSRVYGTINELEDDLSKNRLNFPCVIKKAEGAMSRGVFLAQEKSSLLKYAKAISNKHNIKGQIKETIRTYKHKNYKIESPYQGKFIVQNFVPNLTNDWKVLIYGNHYYVLNRGIRKNDFRASGSHFNYKAGSQARITETMLFKIKEIYNAFNIPHLSLDFAWDGKNAIIHEFQAVYFGTSTMDFSKDLFVFENEKWNILPAKQTQEEEYAYSLINYLEKTEGKN